MKKEGDFVERTPFYPGKYGFCVGCPHKCGDACALIDLRRCKEYMERIVER